jgi:hypothetical protein
MRRFALSAVALCALLSASACCSSTNGCSPSDAAIDGQKSPAATVLPVTRIRAEPYPLTFNSGIEEPARVVATSANQWAQLWSAIWRNHSPKPALPQVDFAAEMVVVAAMGTRNSGGHAIYVDSAYQHSDRIEVVIRTVSPGPRCGTTAALTEPVDVARIPASSLPVRFRERGTVHECP